MAFLKINSGVQTALVVLALLAASPQIARADATTLTCTAVEKQSDPPFTIDIDESNKLVTVHYGEKPTKYTAVFDSKEITFQDDLWDYTINRSTNVVSLHSKDQIFHWNCEAGKAK